MPSSAWPAVWVALLCFLAVWMFLVLLFTYDVQGQARMWLELGAAVAIGLSVFSSSLVVFREKCEYQPPPEESDPLLRT
jgi:hypothetical protein